VIILEYKIQPTDSCYLSFFSTHSCANNEAIGNHFGGSFSISSVDMDADGGKCTNYDAL
jgi:hypothetical protein